MVAHPLFAPAPPPLPINNDQSLDKKISLTKLSETNFGKLIYT